MHLHKKKAAVIFQALEEWAQEKLITPKLKDQLQKTVHTVPFDWHRLARYSFIVAIIAVIISVTSFLADQIIIDFIKLYLGAPVTVKTIGFGAISTLLFLYGYSRKQTKPNTYFLNDAIFCLGVLSYASTLFYLGQFLQLQASSYRHMIFLGCISYGVIGYLCQSSLIWMFSLISLGGWMGAETGYLSGWGAYYLGMSYPARFIFFGGALTAIALNYEEPRFQPFRQTTLVMGLLYLFIALWFLSIFGNYGDIESWGQVKQYELIHWGLVFGVVSILAILHGLKHDNTTTRAFGLVFLFINLYTRFFEYCWNNLHSGIFWGILAISLWFIGSRAEKIWNFQLEVKKEKDI